KRTVPDPPGSCDPPPAGNGSSDQGAARPVSAGQGRPQGSRRRSAQPRRGERRDGTVGARLQRGDGAPVARAAARAEGRGGAGAEEPWTDPGGLAREGARTVLPHEAGSAKLVGGGDGEPAHSGQTGFDGAERPNRATQPGEGSRCRHAGL